MAGSRWARLLRHRWWDERDAHRVLPPAALARIGERVHAGEQQHGGEIRVVVEPGLPLSYLWRGLTARDRAVTLFGKLRVWDTEHNNGVLIYLLLAERAIEVVADRGIARHVPAERWQAIVAGMRASFRDGRFEQGLLAAVDAVTAELVRVAPAAQGATRGNELPDAPLML